jgi:hypothetical protein
MPICLDETISALTATRDRLRDSPAVAVSEVDSMTAAVYALSTLRVLLFQLGSTLTDLSNDALSYHGELDNALSKF